MASSGGQHRPSAWQTASLANWQDSSDLRGSWAIGAPVPKTLWAKEGMHSSTSVEEAPWAIRGLPFLTVVVTSMNRTTLGGAITRMAIGLMAIRAEGAGPFQLYTMIADAAILSNPQARRLGTSTIGEPMM